MLPTALVVALIAMFSLNAASVFAQEDIIQITKTPVTPVEVVTGGTVKFTINVNNNTDLNVNPDIGLINVVVTDDKCPGAPLSRTGGDTDNDNVLDPTETWVYECTVTNILQGFINKAEVQANRQDNNNPVSDSDVVQVNVLNRGVHVTKTAGAPIVAPGNAVFTIIVRNTGANAIPRANITVNDAICQESVAGKLPVPAGADLAGDDPATPAIDGGSLTLICTVPNVTSDTTNAVTVQATDSAGLTFSHFASATQTVLQPGLAITKSPDKPTVLTVGGVARVVWSIKVFNTGQLVYTAANVTDAACPGVPVAPPVPAVPAINTLYGPIKTNADSDTDLEPGENWEYLCYKDYGPGTITNSATVNTTPATGSPKTATAQVVVVNSAAPVLLEKNPPLQFVLKGQTATFTFRVINNTNPPVALGNVQVIDADCTTPVTYVGGDTDGDKLLDANYPPPPLLVDESEIWTFTCSRANVQNSYLNAATVKATVNGLAVSGNATSIVTVINPGINIEKTVTPASLLKGQTATFNLRVTNRGNAELSNVVVTDAFCDAPGVAGPAAGNDADNDGKLDPAEVWNYTCTKANVTADFDNTASVTAKDPLNNPVNASVTVKVDVLDPKLQLEKTPAFQQVNEGDIVKWQLRIRNTGQALVLNPGPGTINATAGQAGAFAGPSGIIDALCSNLPGAGTLARLLDAPGDNDGSLEASEVWVFDCTADSLITYFSNDIINTAVALFTDTAVPANQYSTSERARVQVISKGLDVVKSASPAVAIAGNNVDFTFTLRNLTSPTRDLQTVAVSDAMCSAAPVLQAGSDANGDGKLNQNEVWVYKCTVTNVQADFINTVTATAVDANGNPYRDTATASVVVINAKLNVIKSTTTPIVGQGANVNFTIQAQNTGAFDLSNVVVTDAMCQGGAPTGPAGDNGDGKLNPGETWTYSCVVANVQGDFTNKADVTAKEPSGQPVTGSGSAAVTVLKPGINLEKTPDTQSVLSGQTANFTLIVSNNGNATLSSVQVTDGQCNVGPTVVSNGNGNSTLEPGETWTYSCAINNVTSNFINSAAVTASSGAQSVADTDTASVTVLTPGIRIDKTPDQQTVASGGTANFTINVSNPGTAPLSSVAVNDPLCSAAPLARTSGDTDNDNVLDPGEIWVYTCSIANVTQSFDNTASVSASTGAGTVNASDIAKVTVQTTPPPSGSLVLAQTVNPSTIVKGGSATFRATLANGTATNMTGITLSGDKCKSFTRLADAPGNNDATLNSGETWVWECVLTKVTKTTTNKVTAKVKTPKQTLTASIKLTVTNGRDLIIDEDPNEVSGTEVLVDGEGKVIDEAQLLNKNYLPIVIGEEE